MTRELTATARTDSGPLSGRSGDRARPRPITPSEAAAMHFLTDILVGDTSWSLAEVEDLVALHILVALGHWHGDGLHEGEPATA